jgi:hypothetical protein
LYAIGQADPQADDPELRDLSNEKFWQKLRNIFRDTRRDLMSRAVILLVKGLNQFLVA